MKLTSIRQKASLAILTISLVACFMVAIGWQAMRVSESSLAEFEARTLPEISTALTLAEGVAQLAATAPYTASSARPFQLQTEAKQLQTRIQALRGVARSLIDSEFKDDVNQRLDELQATLEELVKLVREELYIREDNLAQQFRIRVLEDSGVNEGELSVERTKVLFWLLKLIENPGHVSQDIVDDLDLLHQVQPSKDITERFLAAQKRMNEITERKTYLLISTRAKSELLSERVSNFVGILKKRVSRQREKVAEVVANGQLWIFGISALLLIGLVRLYWYSQRMTKDLEAVTHDMEALAKGALDSNTIQLDRDDEIGTLVDAFEVFRRDAIYRIEVTLALSEQKRLLETIFDNMNDGLSVFSAKGELIAWNQGYEAVFSLQKGDLHVGMTLADVQRLISMGAHRNLSIENELVYMDEVNESRHHSSQSFERHFDDGRIIEFRSKPMPEGGFVTLYTDLTERKSVESQLRQAQKMEMLGQLTGGVAHDFNNLLAAIMGNLQLLSDSEPLSSDQRRYTERALAVSEKSSNLVQRLLAFSRRQQLFPECTHIDDLIEGMLDLVEYSVGSHIQVKPSLNCPDVHCLIDPSQLENALLNLSLNSAAAMPSGGTLTFSTKACTLPDSDVPAIRIKVEDTGDGIPKEVLARIFEPFFTTKPVGKGSGLGLSMIYGFVKQSGGDIIVTSEEGKWTKVCIFLPQQAMAHASSKTSLAASADISETVSVPVPDDALIWLVEDDEEVRNVMRSQLSQLGFIVQSFDRVETVLESLEKAMYPDVILSDVNLAGVRNGVELAHYVKKNDVLSGIPVVLMSGLPKQELQEKYTLTDDDLLLSKPFTIRTLESVFKSRGSG
ncbi:PAS-domain containing protein [Marinomonas mediterranea]|uniref:histidine kinase n=1 Tax=Marinomonas mediterranea (strain ATCC 700492 / JCM 21426 / NBRC 103028 / MMB-1) TaxID=717774 RepID=F2JZA0_MARM1|nr:PAS-domain containing protein [Marinomonas mediterranea]ADZ93185.1 multi-sensor hybrid histidine kinase [Marinomonas mediterranea MMB-1]WCN19186.1 response regulator [Marinomonas mediterranea MMB-1]